MDKKRCTKCNKIKSISQYNKDPRAKDNKSSYCKVCAKKNAKQNRKKNCNKWEGRDPRKETPDKTKKCPKCGDKKYIKNFHLDRSNPDGLKHKCKHCTQKYQNDRRDNIRNKVIEYYGGRCVCCGESMKYFLEVDHADNDGSEHRKQLTSTGAGHHIYTWIIKNDYPDHFQILCRNCNYGKYRNGGICPHEE